MTGMLEQPLFKLGIFKCDNYIDTNSSVSRISDIYLFTRMVKKEIRYWIKKGLKKKSVDIHKFAVEFNTIIFYVSMYLSQFINEHAIIIKAHNESEESVLVSPLSLFFCWFWWPVEKWIPLFSTICICCRSTWINSGSN